MDAVDFDILAALARAPRQTMGELGATIGLSANAAKARVHRMQETGVLQGFAAIPRPSLLGAREGLLLFTGVEDADLREHEMLAGLAEVPGVLFTDIALDHAVYVWIHHRGEADWERIERAAISLVGKPPARAVRDLSEIPEPGHALAPADWRILRALAPDARAHAKDLATRADLTFKPLKRRLAALLDDGHARVMPVISPSEAAGAVLFRVVCFLSDPDATIAVPERAIVSRDAPGVICVLAQRDTLREARQLARELDAAPGIERALLQLGTRRASLAWLDETLARAARPKPATAATVQLAPVPKAR